MSTSELECGDITHFDNYFFTDTGKPLKHFALVLLPTNITGFDNSILCSVITSKKPSNWKFLPLQHTKYKCFTLESYACLDRRDLQSLNDLSKTFIKEHLKIEDKKNGLAILKKVLYTDPDIDLYLRATIIREWKSSLV